jgi:hypothetical protein
MQIACRESVLIYSGREFIRKPGIQEKNSVFLLVSWIPYINFICALNYKWSDSCCRGHCYPLAADNMPTSLRVQRSSLVREIYTRYFSCIRDHFVESTACTIPRGDVGTADFIAVNSMGIFLCAPECHHAKQDAAYLYAGFLCDLREKFSRQWSPFP